MPYERFVVTMTQDLKTFDSKPFAMTCVLDTSFRVCICLPRMLWWEGKNRNWCEMARTMLDRHRTPMRFWAEVVNTASYVLNRIFL
jgi:hypothetical protein